MTLHEYRVCDLLSIIIVYARRDDMLRFIDHYTDHYTVYYNVR